jgi:hypothetical protein
MFYGIPAFVLLLMILFPSFNKQELKKFLSRNKSHTMKLIDLLKNKL